jgi:predicted  nucleic acid-binding Zn-ribbon protein
MSAVATLFRLQQFDTERDRLRARIKAIDGLLAGPAELRTTSEALQAAERAVRLASAAASTMKDEHTALDNKRAASEQRLYNGSVKIPKELQDLQREIDSLAERTRLLEERQLTGMLEEEAAEAARAAAADAQAQCAAAWQLQAAALRTEREECDARISAIATERTLLTTQVSPIHLTLYEQVRTAKNGVAITRILAGSCGACGIAPSTARIQEARNNPDPVKCGNCGRILYAA